MAGDVATEGWVQIPAAPPRNLIIWITLENELHYRVVSRKNRYAISKICFNWECFCFSDRMLLLVRFKSMGNGRS